MAENNTKVLECVECTKCGARCKPGTQRCPKGHDLTDPFIGKNIYKAKDAGPAKPDDGGGTGNGAGGSGGSSGKFKYIIGGVAAAAVVVLLLFATHVLPITPPESPTPEPAAGEIPTQTDAGDSGSTDGAAGNGTAGGQGSESEDDSTAGGVRNEPPAGPALLMEDTFYQFTPENSYDREGAKEAKAFGSNYSRKDISSVTFQDTLTGKPDDAWDISDAQDGSAWGWVKQQGGFYQLTLAAEGGMKAPEDLSGMFAGYANLRTIAWNGVLDFSGAKNLRFLFCECAELKELDLSPLSSARPTNLWSLLNGCAKLETADLSEMNTAEVIDMAFLFNDCASLNSVKFGRSFVNSNVEDLRGMFQGCESLASLDLRGFDTSSVKNMAWMFNGCKALTELRFDPALFQTKKVESFYAMFFQCEKLIDLDLSGIDFSSVTDTSWMLGQCESLETLNRNWIDLSNVDKTDGMFFDCSSLTSLNFNGSVRLAGFMFAECLSLETLWFEGELKGAESNSLLDCSLDLYCPASDESWNSFEGQLLGGSSVHWIPVAENGIRVLEGTEGIDGMNCKYLFDRQSNTSWCVEFDGTAYVQWVEPEEKKVTAVIIWSCDDSSENPNRFPKEWKLLGYNADGEWVEIKSFTRGSETVNDNVAYKYDATVTDQNGRRVPYSNLDSYQYFYLEVSATAGEPILQFSDIEVIDEPY